VNKNVQFKNFFLISLIVLSGNTFSAEKGKKVMQQKKPVHVIKKILDNGLTVLVKPTKTIPKVCIQIWYNVGSKDEKSGEKGIAHLIEHMIFKGTEKLSESDINVVVHKLSGKCNAFTSYDFTGYLFEMPTHHWKKTLPIIADCMTSASFKDEHLNSEMKAVVQELKMINDQHTRSLAYKIISLLFADHPYHYPLIGYKQDLWNVRGNDLKKFYKKHYMPNNAALVVVGDVDPEDVFTLAKKHFGVIKPNKDYQKEKFHLDDDISSKTLTMYRDIQLPEVMLSFRVPGSKEKADHILNIAALALANGKSSRLHKRLVDKEQLVTSISAFNWNMFDHGIFFFHFEPKNLEDIDAIESIIFDEIQNIAQKGLSEKELTRATKMVQMDYYSKIEDIEKQAYDIGRCFLATGDQEYAFTYFDEHPKEIDKKLKSLLANYFRSTVACRGILAPLPEEEKAQWKKLQENSDAIDKKILSERIRKTDVEPPRYANNIKIETPDQFNFPKAESFDLSNGIKVLHYNNKNTPKINLFLSLRAKSYYDSEAKPGTYNFVMQMLSEGTKNYSGEELADALESRGITFEAAPGFISMSLLRSDLEFGLELLYELLTNATFSKNEIKKVKEQLLASIKEFWDSPMHFSRQLINERVYKDHPYSKNILGTKESLDSIKQKDLQSFYKNHISPDGAILSIVGDLSGHKLQNILEKNVGSWKGKLIKQIDFPKLQKMKKQTINYFINRDQVVLCFAGLSINRTHKDYDKLWLFDQIFGGGELHSMNSKLIQLREQSGLFYTIGGSLTSGANEQPGKVLVKTIVSLDRLQEAEDAIKKTIDTSVKTIDPQQFEQARLAISNALVNHFESNAQIALSFLFLEKYKLPADYFDNRAQELMKLTIKDVQNAVKNVLNSDNMITLRIGRVLKEIYD